MSPWSPEEKETKQIIIIFITSPSVCEGCHVLFMENTDDYVSGLVSVCASSPAFLSTDLLLRSGMLAGFASVGAASLLPCCRIFQPASLHCCVLSCEDSSQAVWDCQIGGVFYCHNLLRGSNRPQSWEWQSVFYCLEASDLDLPFTSPNLEKLHCYLKGPAEIMLQAGW